MLSHSSNPKNYNDDQDARPYDARLRAPVRPIEIAIDPETGMKNYIANGRGDWATSAAFVKYSFTQSIHHGRLYTSGSGIFSKGNDEDLAEACRLLGQGLHTLEDFGAHSNYVELALIELGHRNVFPLVGRNTQINVRGKHIWPLVTGTFGMVDFYHSVLGEATDHFTQSEVNEMSNAMGMAEQAANSSNPLTTLVKLLSKVPGTSGLCDEAQKLQEASQAEARRNRQGGNTRAVDDFSSSRAVDDYGSSRSGPGDYPGAGHYGAASHYQQGGNYQGTYHAGYQQGGYNTYDQQQYNEGYNNYAQPAPSQQWGQQPHDQWSRGQRYQQPPPPQQWHNSPQPDQWNTGSGWQQPPNQPQQWQGQGGGMSMPPQQSSNPSSAPGKPQGLEGMPDFDPSKTIKQIYPILAFRDKVVRSISAIIEKIPGLEALVERIVETLTVFIFSLLAPFVRPVLNALQKTLQSSSEGVTEWNKKHQYEVWDDPDCSDPTHSMLSKDHFSNILNEPAGAVAGEILKFIAPRILYAWEHAEVPVERVMADVESIFHHPALRNEHGNECHRNMFNVVRKWSQGRSEVDSLLSAQAVRQGKNHKEGVDDHAGHGSAMGTHGSAHGHSGGAHGGGNIGAPPGGYGAYLQQAENVIGGFTGHHGGAGGHSNPSSGLGGVFQQAESFLGGGKPPGGSGSGASGGGLNDMLSMASKLPGVGKYSSQLGQFNKLASAFGGGGRRELPSDGARGLPEDDGDYGDSDRYVNMGLSSVGGANDLYESALRAERAGPTPSPGPMAVPSGYEAYSGGSDALSSRSESGYGGQAQEGYHYGQQQGHEEQQSYGYAGGYGQGSYQGGGEYTQEQTGGYGSQQFPGQDYGGRGDNYYR